MKVVHEVSGHPQISITMDLYSHSMPTLQRETVAKGLSKNKFPLGAQVAARGDNLAQDVRWEGHTPG